MGHVRLICHENRVAVADSGRRRVVIPYPVEGCVLQIRRDHKNPVGFPPLQLILSPVAPDKELVAHRVARVNLALAEFQPSRVETVERHLELAPAVSRLVFLRQVARRAPCQLARPARLAVTSDRDRILVRRDPAECQVVSHSLQVDAEVDSEERVTCRRGRIGTEIRVERNLVIVPELKRKGRILRDVDLAVATTIGPRSGEVLFVPVRTDPNLVHRGIRRCKAQRGLPVIAADILQRVSATP